MPTDKAAEAAYEMSKPGMPFERSDPGTLKLMLLLQEQALEILSHTEEKNNPQGFFDYYIDTAENFTTIMCSLAQQDGKLEGKVAGGMVIALLAGLLLSYASSMRNAGRQPLHPSRLMLEAAVVAHEFHSRRTKK